MNPIISKRISVCNVAGTILIVLLHSSAAGNIYADENNYFFAYSWFKVINIISDAAVPTFFAISGFLLFKDYRLENYSYKVKQRVKSLIIPYFCYSIILFVYYSILSFLPALHSSSMAILEGFSAKTVIKTILLAKCDPPIWYLRVLFCLVVISPIFHYIIKKLQKKTFLLIFVLAVINAVVHSPYSSPLYWCPVFLLGAICADQVRYRNILSKDYSLTCVIAVIGIYALLVIVLFFDIIPGLYYIYRMLAPGFIWVLTSKTHTPNNIPFWYKTTFFVFCLHYPVAQFVRIILTGIIGGNNIGLVFINVITTAEVFIVINLLAYFLQKKCLKIWGVINGGR